MAKFSRLIRKQESKNIRMAVIYGLLTIVLAIGVIILGIPALIRLAVFLGDLKSSSIPIETKDTIPPSPPIFTTTLEATNSAKLNIAGYAEPGSKVILYIDGQQLNEVIADSDGLFKTDVNLVEGNNDIFSYAQDSAGNKSVKSTDLNIGFINKPPKLEITTPDKDQSSTDQNKITIIGITESETNLMINDHLVIVSKSGDFQYPISLNTGENQINIVATDKAGNKTEKMITINFAE